MRFTPAVLSLLALAAASLSAAPRAEEPAKVTVVRVDGAPKQARDVQVKVTTTAEDAKDGKRVKVIRVEATGADSASLQAEVDKALAAAGVEGVQVKVDAPAGDATDGKAVRKQVKIVRTADGGETVTLVGPEAKDGLAAGKVVKIVRADGGETVTLVGPEAKDGKAVGKTVKIVRTGEGGETVTVVGPEGEGKVAEKHLKILRAKGGETVDLVGPDAKDGKTFVFVQKGAEGQGSWTFTGQDPQAELKALKAAVASLQTRIQELEKKAATKP